MQRATRVTRTVDFHVHDIVGIRLVDASESDISSVESVLGRAVAAISGAPEMFVRFVPKLTTEHVTFAEFGRNGFAGDNFHVLEWNGQSTHATVPFDRVGGIDFEVTCERGAGPIPLLLPLIQLLAIRKGFVPLHASAFRFNGTGVLFTGWSHSGKTEGLLAFADRGAEYVGDECVFLRGDGTRMHGIPLPLELSHAHLCSDVICRSLHGRRRLVLLMGAVFDRMMTGSLLLRRSQPTRKLASKIAARFLVHVRPSELFGNGMELVAKPDVLILALSTASGDSVASPVSGSEWISCLAQIMACELSQLMRHYAAFRFAFPARRNILIEEAQDRYTRLLLNACRGMRVFTLRHPYPVDTNDLFAATAAIVADAVSDMKEKFTQVY